MTTYQSTIHKCDLGLATQPAILIYALWRSGTHWLSEMVSDLTGLPSFYHSDEHADYTDETFEQINQYRENTVLIRHICASPDRLLSHTAALNIPVIFLYRDPRDVIASHVNMRKHREGYRPGLPPFPEMSIDEILDWELQQHGDLYCKLLTRWADTRHDLLLTVRYEDLMTDTHSALSRIAMFLGLDVSQAELLRITVNHSFGFTANHSPNSDTGGRRAAIGDFRNQFTQAQQQRLVDTLGSALTKLGYSPEAD